MERLGGGPTSLELFADSHNLVMVITERSRQWGLPRYLARFESVEIGGDGMLRGAHGNGDTPQQAIADYAKQIAGAHLVVNAYKSDRRTLDAPNELTTDADCPRCLMGVVENPSEAPYCPNCYRERNVSGR